MLLCTVELLSLLLSCNAIYNPPLLKVFSGIKGIITRYERNRHRYSLVITHKLRLRESGLLDECAPQILRCAQDDKTPGCHPERSEGSIADLWVITSYSMSLPPIQVLVVKRKTLGGQQCGLAPIANACWDQFPVE